MSSGEGLPNEPPLLQDRTFLGVPPAPLTPLPMVQPPLCLVPLPLPCPEAARWAVPLPAMRRGRVDAPPKLLLPSPPPLKSD